MAANAHRVNQCRGPFRGRVRARRPLAESGALGRAPGSRPTLVVDMSRSVMRLQSHIARSEADKLTPLGTAFRDACARLLLSVGTAGL
jgi:hypothetical protein